MGYQVIGIIFDQNKNYISVVDKLCTNDELLCTWKTTKA